MVEVPVLSDGVVRLRAHAEDDVDRVVEQAVDPLSVRWTVVPSPYSRDDAKQFVRHAMPGGWASDREWGFAVEYDGRFGGTVSLRNRDDRRAEVAYGSHPGVRGKGVMERALRLLLGWGFAPAAEGGRDLETVVWLANEGNWASRKLAWRVGFSFDGTLRGWLPHRGELVDAWTGTLRRDEEMTPRGVWLDTPVVELPALRLRPLRPADDPVVVEACSDPVAQHWLGMLPSPYRLSDARWWREDRQHKAATGTAVTWAITDPAEDRIVGAINLFGIGGPVPEAEVGYWVAPWARGRGVATAATRAALRHAFVPVTDGGLGLDRVEAVAAVENAASRRVLTGAGLRECGTERRAVPIRGGAADGVRYEILAEEFVAEVNPARHP